MIAGVVSAQALAIGIGLELIENGDFASDDGWERLNTTFSGNGASIAGPQAPSDSNGYIARALEQPLAAGATYRLTVSHTGLLTVIFSGAAASAEVSTGSDGGSFEIDVAGAAWSTVTIANRTPGSLAAVSRVSLRRIA